MNKLPTLQVYNSLNELPENDVTIVQLAYEVVLKMLLRNQDLLNPFLQLAGQ